MTILALDISKTNTGWAAGGYGKAIEFGSRSFAGCGARPIVGHRFAAFVDRMVTVFKPAVLVIEAPLLYGGAPFLLIPMGYEAEKAAYRHNIKFHEFQPNSIKKFMAGTKNASKGDMVHAARARGHKVKNDDEADAVAILLMYEARTNGKNPAV